MPFNSRNMVMPIKLDVIDLLHKLFFVLGIRSPANANHEAITGSHQMKESIVFELVTLSPAFFTPSSGHNPN